MRTTIEQEINDMAREGRHLLRFLTVAGALALAATFPATAQVVTGNPGGNCIPAAADYDGDGDTDYAQLCDGTWHFYNPDGSYLKGIWVGNIAGIYPVPADYNGDGADDPVVFNNGAWTTYDFQTGAFASALWTGPSGALGVTLDYNGDGLADRSTYLNGAWHFFNANGSYNKGIWVGNIPGLTPVPGDYTGSGVEAPTMFDGGAWVRYDFATGAVASATWTGPGKPAPLDYDGDGTLDFTVYDNGPWHFFNDDGTYRGGIATGGGANDKPISRRALQ